MTNSPRRYRLTPIVVVFAALSVASRFVSWDLFWFVGGFTAILGVIDLIANWDNIVVWWATRGHKSKS